MNPTQIDCSKACVNGCVLGETCPNLEYRDKASKFIQETSLDDMIEMAAAAARRRMMEPPKWVYPEDLQ
ncbi:MAG: hypothetical protein MUF49_11930 [Oculatellaceae cyanobacterium Prado106]|nr:hypothetical protein [Oculatellaceae cyanobacterium Prado106]